ncbi:MAG: hypothetical protein SFW09_13660 [Hyphomicrobiaceae bacterium]|nr:hypothetical protein [Hyphomicrobiaceae bacterium]
MRARRAAIAFSLLLVVSAVAGAGVMLAREPAASGHMPLHIGCKHQHGSTWLTGRGEMLGYRRSEDDGSADEGPRRLRPFTEPRR